MILQNVQQIALLSGCFHQKNTQKFCFLVHNTAWDEVYSNDSVDACYNSFENKISRCFELSFPYVRLSRERSRDKKWVKKALEPALNIEISCKKWLNHS